MMIEETIVASDKERSTNITAFISNCALLQDGNDRSAVVDGDIDIDGMPDTNQDVVYIETE